MYSDLLIPGKEAEFFALYEVTDKGSSWLGPLVVGLIHSATSLHHLSFIYLLVMTVLYSLIIY
jgi:UMF1 family MFS transporter